MPATALFGMRLRQLAADNAAFYLLATIVQIVWLFIYWIGIAAFSRPQPCDAGTASAGQNYALVFTLLALFIAQAAACAGAFFASLQGTPLEPSKRAWVSRLSTAYLLSLPVNAGLLAWGGWVVEAGDGSCWSSGDKAMPATIVFGAIGVMVGQAVGVLLSYHQLGDVRPGVWWHAATRTGVSSAIHLASNFGQPYRGPAVLLEEVATVLQGLMASVDADKTDAVAGLACAALLQRETAAGPAPGVQAAPAGQQQHEPADVGAAASGADADAPAGVLEWATNVCQGAAAATALGAAAAPVGAEAVAEALVWARYAAAAYGARLHQWRRGELGRCAARRQVACRAAAATAAGERPLAGWGAQPGAPSGGPPDGGRGRAPSKAVLHDFVAAQETLGPGSQVVAFRARQAVVLGIAGDWKQPHAVPAEHQPLPDGWVEDDASAVVEAGATRPCAAGALRIANGGHGLGAGAGALLALRLQAAFPGLAVWAFGPPGELCSRDLAARLADTVCVVTGDDAAPRASSAALDALVEQAIVGLARLRYCKFGLFAAMVAERLGPGRLRGRWLNPARALCPLDQVTPEALRFLHRHQRWRQGRSPAPPSTLPGRVLLLSRPCRPAEVAPSAGRGDMANSGEAKPAGQMLGVHAAGTSTASSTSSGGSRDASGATHQQWQAGWLQPERLADGGLRVTRHSMSDHRASRLLAVLGDLAAPSTRTTSRRQLQLATMGLGDKIKQAVTGKTPHETSTGAYETGATDRTGYHETAGHGTTGATTYGAGTAAATGATERTTPVVGGEVGSTVGTGAHAHVHTGAAERAGYATGATGTRTETVPVGVVEQTTVTETPVVEERLVETRREAEAAVCGQEYFTKTEDRPVVRERVEYIKEHRPVEKEFVVETRATGVEREVTEGRVAEHLGTQERVVSEAAPRAPCE
eukprot:scaffold4.g4647.t1